MVSYNQLTFNDLVTRDFIAAYLKIQSRFIKFEEWANCYFVTFPMLPISPRFVSKSVVGKIEKPEPQQPMVSYGMVIAMTKPQKHFNGVTWSVEENSRGYLIRDEKTGEEHWVSLPLSREDIKVGDRVKSTHFERNTRVELAPQTKYPRHEVYSVCGVTQVRRDRNNNRNYGVCLKNIETGEKRWYNDYKMHLKYADVATLKGRTPVRIGGCLDLKNLVAA